MAGFGSKPGRNPEKLGEYYPRQFPLNGNSRTRKKLCRLT